MRFAPKAADFAERARAIFAQQQVMTTLGVAIAEIAPGRCILEMPYAPGLSQQNGFVHAGIVTTALDTACGLAAFSLMPAGADILTVEFKASLLAPASGERFLFRAEIVKPGRTLTFAEARAFAVTGGEETLVATMSGTLMTMLPRPAAG